MYIILINSFFSFSFPLSFIAANGSYHLQRINDFDFQATQSLSQLLEPATDAPSRYRYCVTSAHDHVPVRCCLQRPKVVIFEWSS